MFGEKSFKEPMIDPLARGHVQADKKIEQEKRKNLEMEADRRAKDEKEEEKLDREEEQLARDARQKELDELYGEDKDVMSDIFPSWQKNN